MHCRPPRRVKRYITDPDQYSNEHRAKYNNCTLQQLKLQVNAIDTLNDISVPAIPYLQSHHKNNNTFMPLHSKFHLRRNPLKKLPDLNTQLSNNNGCELPNAIKTPQMFKKSNPLFVVNSLFDILKEDLSSDQNHPDKLKRNPKQKTKHQDNEFSEFEGKSVKVHRGPRLVDSELSRLTQQSQFSRRKIYSEEKSRKKVEEVELLTFYKPKGGLVQEKNQFLS